MDNEKAIKEMAREIQSSLFLHMQLANPQDYDKAEWIARALIASDYGNIPQALTEFAEKVIYNIGLLWNINGNNHNIKCAQEMVRTTLKEFLKQGDKTIK